jgi:chromosome condensin MukBEF complex kleisin-like MukF subunit
MSDCNLTDGYGECYECNHYRKENNRLKQEVEDMKEINHNLMAQSTQRLKELRQAQAEIERLKLCENQMNVNYDTIRVLQNDITERINEKLHLKRQRQWLAMYGMNWHNSCVDMLRSHESFKNTYTKITEEEIIKQAIESTKIN